MYEDRVPESEAAVNEEGYEYYVVAAGDSLESMLGFSPRHSVVCGCDRCEAEREAADDAHASGEVG